MENKKVLILSDYAAPYVGNFISSLKIFGELLRTNWGGLSYYWFIEAAKGKEWVDSLPNIYYLKSGIFKAVRQLNLFVRKNNVDIIYTHFCSAKMMLIVNVVKVLNQKVKVVEHFHNHYEGAKNPIKEMLKRAIYRADLYIGCSKGVAESLPYKLQKVHYVDNGLYFQRLDKYEKVRLVPKGDFAILMFSHTYKRKGVDLAIRTLRKLDNPKIKLLICESSDQEELREDILNEFGEIPEFVEILGPRNDVATYYHNVDLFISPSREEGLCYSPLEAMYCGTPCICSDIDGHARDIPDLILCKPGDADDLSRQIGKVYEGENKFEARKVRRYLEQNYSVDR